MTFQPRITLNNKKLATRIYKEERRKDTEAKDHPVLVAKILLMMVVLINGIPTQYAMVVDRQLSKSVADSSEKSLLAEAHYLCLYTNAVLKS